MSDVLDDQARITQPEAAKLLGGVTQMTIWRWRTNPALNFPRSLQINNRHYYVRSEILNWRPPLKPIKPTKKPGRRLASAG